MSRTDGGMGEAGGGSGDGPSAGRGGRGEGRCTPGEARDLVARLPAASWRLAAQAVALRLLVEDVPPAAFAPRALLPVARPLLDAGLGRLWMPDERDAAGDEFYRGWGAGWGDDPPHGLYALDPTNRLIALVLALLTGAPQDGVALERRVGELRAYPAAVLPGGGSEGGGPEGGGPEGGA